MTSPDPEVEEAAGYLVARFGGALDVPNFHRQVQAAVLACRERGRRRLLLDGTRMTGMPSTLERFQLGEQGAAAAAGVLDRVAIVARPDQIDPQKFGVLVARNRGLQVDVFPEAALAEAWLRGEPDDAALLRGFEAASLPRDAWTHRAHLRTAYLHLLRQPLPEALERFRRFLRALNAAHAAPEELRRGYHETLTQAWLRLAAAALRARGPAADSGAFCDRHPELLVKGRIEVHYSLERLFSAEAKIAFVEPDRRPLP